MAEAQMGLGLADPWPGPTEIQSKSGWKFTVERVLVDTPAKLEAMERDLEDAESIAYDTETSGLKTNLGARIVGHSVARLVGFNGMKAWYVPVRHIGGHNENHPQIDPALAAAVFSRVLTRVKAVGYHHAKFDWAMARADGIPIPDAYVDTSILATIDNENEHSFSLKRLSAKYMADGSVFDEKVLYDWMRKDARSLDLHFKDSTRLKVEDIEDIDLMLDDKSYLERYGFARTPIALCGAYACMDVVMTLYLWQVKYANTWKRYPDVTARDHAVQRILHEMEWNGLQADIEEIRRAEEATRGEVLHWLARCRELTGREDFTASDNEIRQVLFDELKLDPPKQTKGRWGKDDEGNNVKKTQASVDDEARRLIAAQYPEHKELIDAIGHLAKATKIHGTYALSFIKHYSEETGCIHGTYNQLERREMGGAPVTGRLSSSDPNVQNIASRPLELHDGTTVSVRRYFTVPADSVRAYVDFSQIELRVLTYFCQDPVLLHAYANDLDIHQQVADQLKIDRKVAKQVNFGNSYGMTEIGLAKRLPGYYEDPDGMREFAKEVLANYFREFNRILTFRAQFAREMKRNGCMFTNPFGRPRRIPTIKSPQRWERERAERMMMSSIISGTSADILKESMLRVDRILRERGNGSLKQTIHDEIVIDFQKDSPWASTLIECVRAMEDWPQFERAGVPIRASIELTTTTWEDKRPIKLLPSGHFVWETE